MDATVLRLGFLRWSDALSAVADELNELDARLGDGDLGTTLARCAQNVKAELTVMPDSLAQVFKISAQACAKASGSSFGTLLTLAFFDAAQWASGRATLAIEDIAGLLAHTQATLSARGGASLGDKTMLDSIHAVAVALEGEGNAQEAVRLARAAAIGVMDEFRDKPSRIGRARMFAEKSIGMDDPGMVAVLRMIESL